MRAIQAFLAVPRVALPTPRAVFLELLKDLVCRICCIGKVTGICLKTDLSNLSEIVPALCEGHFFLHRTNGLKLNHPRYCPEIMINGHSLTKRPPILDILPPLF